MHLSIFYTFMGQYKPFKLISAGETGSKYNETAFMALQDEVKQADDVIIQGKSL